MKDFLHYFLQFIPPFPQILAYISVSAAAILLSGFLSGGLKRYAGWKTGYTRKTLHFLIFFTAVGLHIWGGLPAVNMLGIGMGIFVLLSVKAGDRNFFFEAMAREKDFPRRGYFIIVPYLTTAAGGIASNLLFGSSAIMGYVLCGSADAVAEPIGLRFGKHRYKVPSLRKVRISERSMEGSLSIFIVSVILSALFFLFLYHLPLAKALVSSLFLSFAVVIVEAFSFHGADNLTIQITASALTYLFTRLWS
jgi:phytol kinase